MPVLAISRCYMLSLCRVGLRTEAIPRSVFDDLGGEATVPSAGGGGRGDGATLQISSCASRLQRWVAILRCFEAPCDILHMCCANRNGSGTTSASRTCLCQTALSDKLPSFLPWDLMQQY